MTTVSEFDVLATCALRIDGYAWAKAQGIEWSELLGKYREPGMAGALLEAPLDEQWTVWFLQQRAYRWNEDEPRGEGLALWRRLFLSLAEKRPTAPFDCGGPDGSDYSVRAWEASFKPILASLQLAITERLARNAPLDEPLELELMP
jgi:hypothetical protein